MGSVVVNIALTILPGLVGVCLLIAAHSQRTQRQKLGKSTLEVTMIKSRLFVVLPAYNEADNLDALLSNLERAFTAISNVGYAREYVIVDDGSSDDTLTNSRTLEKGCADHDFKTRAESRTWTNNSRWVETGK